jgi:hypothetical protein
MAAPATPTFQLNWLNTWFKRLDRVHNASIQASPVLADMTFVTTGGTIVAQPFTLNGHRGESGRFDAAQTVAAQSGFRNSSKYRWQVPYGTYVGSIQVEHRDIALSRQDRDAAARALENETNMAFKQRASNLMRLFFATLGNQIGHGTLASGVFTFDAGTRESAALIFQGDMVEFSSTDGTSGNVTGSPGFVTKSESEVASAATGRISVSATSATGTVGNPAGVPDGTYFLYRYGEFNSGDTTAILTPLQAYLPSAPSTADLHNVKRANDVRLCGLRMPDAQLSGRSIGSKIKIFIANAQVVAGVDGAEIDTVILNPLDWAKAEEEFTTTVNRNPSEVGEDGFSRMYINTANGRTKLVSEPHCPQGVMFFVASGQLVFHSPTGTIAQWADEEGSIVRRKETELVYEMVPVSYLAPVMQAPYAHGRASTTI